MAIVRILVAIAYPVIIYLALSDLRPRTVALGLLCILIGRFALTAPGKLRAAVRSFWLPGCAVAVAVGAAALWDSPLGLLLTPVIVNLALLSVFAASLFGDQPLVERIALLEVGVGTLTDAELAYCRRVTHVWCAFFCFNAGIALWLALSGSLEAWALYTGFVSYVFMGALFAGELVYRQWRFRRYYGAATDRFLKPLFPPREEPRTVMAVKEEAPGEAAETRSA